MKKNETLENSPVAQFESALKELEEIVAAMERGDLPLEKSLQMFERGTQLSRQCQQALATAELRIKTLLESSTEATPAEREP
jgi:exodeoxyribonuclease VII small subunit